ncbi:TldD/PmbA family protein [Archangium violaceum]|uniref:metallopeptidase TldD-related protein n=1 Tax=Archangium violaceum TaxID=83451 RepID=UPI002B284EB8|nr:TldD/PmbA family protein [Archangium violaceum]
MTASGEHEMPESERPDGAVSCGGLDLGELAREARARMASFTRSQASTGAELFLSASRRLSLEYEVGTGRFSLSRGESVSAAARVWWEEGSGFAALSVGGADDLGRVLSEAWERGRTGARSPLPAVPASSEPPRSLPVLSTARARELAEHLTRTVIPPGVVVQAAVLTCSASGSVLVRGEGVVQGHVSARQEAVVRCETSRGAIVDGVAAPLGEPWDLEPLRARIAQAVDALEGPAEAADPGLPLVLRPAVAAPLVAALAWMLRGDVAVATPALARAVGKKLFPSVLSVEDDPLHPLGASRRSVDDEGAPARPLRLVDEGRFLGFLHSAATAALLGVSPNGRGLRSEGASPTPSALGLFVVPRGDALPEHYTELVARVETFTTMPRPGVVSLMAGGWEVRRGQRVRRLAPVELRLPVLETLRALRGVGADLAFFPTADGCGTPTLILPPLLGG